MHCDALHLKGHPERLFKIGITDQFDRRLSAIRRQNSEQVLVVSTYHGEAEFGPQPCRAPAQLV
jgi:hypothetical protein